MLLIGTVAVWACKGARLGLLALIPWLGAFVLASVTTNTGHSAARIYANWLILILPLAGYGFSLMLSAPWRAAKAVAAVALLYLGLQPVIMRDHLAAQHLEILEHRALDRRVSDGASGVPGGGRRSGGCKIESTCIM